MVSTVPQVLGTILADTLVHTATADPRLSGGHLARITAISMFHRSQHFV